MKDISVLLIEDNKDDEWLTLRVLKKIGLNNVTVARDGITALAKLLGDQETGEGVFCAPDLIVLDLRLPKIDGLDVLRKIRADHMTREIDVLVLTSSEDPHDIDVCKQLGVIAFVSKPLDEKKILDLNLV
jgi:two-component system, response regulator